MARLYRPHTPLSIKVLAAASQLRARGSELDRSVLYGLMLLTPTKKLPFGDPTLTLTRKLASLMQTIAIGFGCEVSELRLDHDPALGIRKKRGEGKSTVYTPDANDPEFLRYRPHGAQHEGSHDVKTRIRGDHGQYSDIVLIKRQRRRERKAAVVNETVKKNRQKMRSGKTRWNSRPFPTGRGFERRK